MTSKARRSPKEQMSGIDWPARKRVVISIVLILHVFAVFVAPWSAPPPSSQLARVLARPFSPYLNLAFLNHGYRFFAPDPGPSHIVRYELDMPDGSTTLGEFPDIKEHWPRLLYHRHFMVSESIYSVTEPFAVAPERESLTDEDWIVFQTEKARNDRLVESVARHLMATRGARRVRMFLRVHMIPAPWDVEAGMQLDDRQLFDERPLGQFEASQPAGESK